MSSLGQIVAGVAHEINNPLNFIHGNIDYVNDCIDNLIGFVNFSQEYSPNITKENTDFLDNINFDFVKVDVPRVMSSIKFGTNRIREIVLTLRNFSRLDESDFKSVDLHEGINSTLLILQSRLQAKSDYPAIKVVKNYANLPKVACYAAELNQVFMNILINAIQALDNSNYQETKTEGVISISTQLLNSDKVSISIQDNGPGIAPDIKPKIFDPFFTTKPVGKGIGLGLSISYQIVVDKHNGEIECFSIPGIGTEFLIKLPLRQKSARI
jgi:signal transduction histidine kinase